MAHSLWLGISLILISGVLNGAFALPMKHARIWRWENTWLVFSLGALLIMPILFAIAFTPKLLDIYRAVPSSSIYYPLLFGFLWGFAQVTFGLGIAAIGMALAFVVVMGLACLFGSLIPLIVLHPADILHARGIALLASIPLLFSGLAFCGIAGHRRERERAGPHKVQTAKLSFTAGLAVCIFTGVFGANLNLGFAFSGHLIPSAQALGASTTTATYAVWALVLCAGFLPNAGYCGILLWCDGTLHLFHAKGWVFDALMASAMASSWFAGIIGYGSGATLVGKYGTSIGFALFIAVTIVVSNLLGFLTGEWKGASRSTMRNLTLGTVSILISVLILNWGGFS